MKPSLSNVECRETSHMKHLWPWNELFHVVNTALRSGITKHSRSNYQPSFFHSKPGKKQCSPLKRLVVCGLTYIDDSLDQENLTLIRKSEPQREKNDFFFRSWRYKKKILLCEKKTVTLSLRSEFSISRNC